MDILFNNYRDIFSNESHNQPPNFPHLENFIFNFDISLKNDSTKKFSLEFPDHKLNQKYQVHFLIELVRSFTLRAEKMNST